ncbi:MAG: hydrogenase maturation nickel metallochaperone HypA [Gammaproteobacteria bacterium]|nr:MAG: hydrogenase maturation nickel metallochaperone HypA [Gammaproteobacteria bacterium]
MHEMSLCEGILQVIEAEAQKQKFTEVKQVVLDIGVLSGVEISALEFAFEVVMRGSVAENAILKINQIEAQAWCMPCSETVTIKQRFDACPNCESYQLQVSSGDEMKIKELEVD